jgi:DNA-binding MarR family transcriptional regulator
MSNLKIFSSNKVPLQPLDMRILNAMLFNGGYAQKNLAEDCKSTIGGVSKALKRLDKYGFIYCNPHPIKIYTLIPERKIEIKKFLSRYDFGKNSPLIVDAHAFIFECEINEISENFEKRLKKEKRWIEYTPNNWRGYKQAYLDGSTIFHKTKKRNLARFYFKTFARSPEIAEMIIIDKFLRRKKTLEDKYPGLKIGGHSIVAKCPYQHVALLRDPLAVAAIKLGIKHKRIEDSHRIGGEWEEKGTDSIEKISKLIKLREGNLLDI